jgi:Protein of unknown function (DUF429)
VSAGGVHQFKGLRGVVADELALALDDVASDNDGFHVGGSGAEDHDGDWVDRWIQKASHRVVEVHPEASFAKLAGAALQSGKSSWAGIALRRSGWA